MPAAAGSIAENSRVNSRARLQFTENNIEFEFGRSGGAAFCVNGDEAALELPELGAVRLIRSARLP
jgi:hypothetical protein